MDSISSRRNYPVHACSSLLLCCVFQAVMLDSTDVSVWYKIGHVALKLLRLPLARHAFEEGLLCNPDHWPCLDNLITVLYTLSDYTSKCCSLAACSRRARTALVEAGAALHFFKPELPLQGGFWNVLMVVVANLFATFSTLRAAERKIQSEDDILVPTEQHCRHPQSHLPKGAQSWVSFGPRLTVWTWFCGWT